MSQTTTLNTVTLKELTDLIRKEFVMNQKMVEPTMARLFITDPIGNGNGNTKRYDEIDTETFARTKLQGEASKKASVGIGYHVIMTKKRIAMEIDITQEMRDENRHAEVGNLITSLSHFCPQRIELDGTHLLTFADATSMVDMDGETVELAVGDGLSLVNNAHTLKFNGATYSNRVAGDPTFSKAGMELAETVATTQIVSNFNERRVLNFNAIITSDDPETVNDVKQFLVSVSDGTQDNSGVANVYRGKYEHIVLPYLATTATGAYDATKRRRWFLGAVGQGANGWQAYYGVWEAPRLKEAPTSESGANHDYSRDIWTFGARAGYAFRAVSGRGLIGSLPTS